MNQKKLIFMKVLTFDTISIICLKKGQSYEKIQKTAMYRASIDDDASYRMRDSVIRANGRGRGTYYSGICVLCGKAQYSAEVAGFNDNEKEIVTIAGRYCESGDILIEEIDLPKLSAGDVICVYNTGAYNYSMSSNYNRIERVAMVLVNSGQSDMIVYRESLEDLIARERIPDRLRKDD